jgi:hypothetical protein
MKREERNVGNKMSVAGNLKKNHSEKNQSMWC